MSKEERERNAWIYENEPYMNGLTQSQFNNLPDDERDRHVQIMMQVPATFLGYWKTCDLSVCRRARQCRGFLSRAQRQEGGYNRSYPPCTGLRGWRQPEMLKALEHCDHLFDAQLRPLAGQSTSDKPASGKTGSGKTGSDKTGSRHAGSDKSGSGKSGSAKSRSGP